MPDRLEVPEADHSSRMTPSCVGLVVHPTRPIDGLLHELRRWADLHHTQLVQILACGQQQRVAEPGKPEQCDLLLAIGGDGTALAAMRAGVDANRPVLTLACGSLGVLTSVAARDIVSALDRFSRGDWVPRLLPSLEVTCESGGQVYALNEIVIVRAGEGQVRLTAAVDGDVFARVAGDGCIVSTPIGSSAYALAAGGPLLAPDMEAFLLTPLPSHGGSCPPLVVGAGSAIRLDVRQGHGGVRLEVDGQAADAPLGPLTVRFRAGAATVVAFRDQERLLAVLRKRQIITDSPRILVEDTQH